MQTLEPRLFYLHVPYSNQDELPLFDTGFYDFSFSQLFRENRFSGADRVGDANQLTTSLTSRYLEDASGKERARASLGQITYFEDRKVGLTPGTTESRTSSESGSTNNIRKDTTIQQQYRTWKQYTASPYKR